MDHGSNQFSSYFNKKNFNTEEKGWEREEEKDFGQNYSTKFKLQSTTNACNSQHWKTHTEADNTFSQSTQNGSYTIRIAT